MHQSSQNVLEVFSTIDSQHAIPVYHQIKNHIQFAIAAGTLAPGDRLPSIRELSDRIGVNANTVATAYRDLEVIGLLYTRRGKGAFIQSGVLKRCREACRAQIADRIQEVMGEARAAAIDPDIVEQALEECLRSETGPYGPPPSALPALAERAARKR